jgi:uncharacterized Zn ribbon protein
MPTNTCENCGTEYEYDETAPGFFRSYCSQVCAEQDSNERIPDLDDDEDSLDDGDDY